MMALATPRSVFARYVDFSLNAPSGQRLDYQIVGNNVVVFIQDDQYRSSITGSLIIPSSVTYAGITYSVTMIGGGAFQDCSGLISVTIPNTVTLIYQRAFDGCSGLTSIMVESGSSVFDSRDNY